MPAEAQFRWPGGGCRLFVGVGLNPAKQQQMAAVLAVLPAELKPVPVQNLHLTHNHFPGRAWRAVGWDQAAIL